MKTTPDRQKRFAAAVAEIAELPEEQQIDALLYFFSTVLHELPIAEIRRKRDELMARFSTCGCSYETCSTLLELVDYHVTRREQFAARQQAEARRAANDPQRPAKSGGIGLRPAFEPQSGPVRTRPAKAKR